MKVTVAALLAIILTLAWLLYAEVATNRQQRSQLDDKTARENLELQEKCALQAESRFRKLNRMRSPDPKKDETDDYKSHYNTKLNKCFMSIETTHITNTTSVAMTTSKTLLDAYELREYANIIWGIDKGKTRIYLCTLTPSLENVQVEGARQNGHHGLVFF